MKQAIATERIYNIFKQLVAIKYHYEDGSTRIIEKKTKPTHKNTKLQDNLK